MNRINQRACDSLVKKRELREPLIPFILGLLAGRTRLLKDSPAIETASGGYAAPPSLPPKPLPLFRQEVILAATGDKFGEPFGKAPLGWSIISLLLIGITASAGVFLATATYARKETARGLLRADGGETRILAQAGGAVRALYVREGERVEKGQVLALIATEVALPGGGVMDETMLAALAAQGAIATTTARLAKLPHDLALTRAQLEA